MRAVLVSEKAKKDAAFEELYRMYVPQVIAVAMHRLSDRHLAEEVVQETFLRAYRDIDKLDPTKPAWPWLAAIVMNLCRDELRLKKLSVQRLSSQPQEAESLIELGSDPADQYVIRERMRAMMAVLEQLRPRHRRVLVLQYGAGLRTVDIAAQEGISEAAAESVLKRARENFRAAYDQAVKERGLQVIFWPVIGAAYFRLRSRLSRAQSLVMNALRPSNVAAYLNSIEGLAATAAVALTVIVGAALLYPATENAFAQPASPHSGNPGPSGNPRASSDGTETLNDEPYEVSHTVRSRDHIQEGPPATVTVYAGAEKGEERTNLHYETGAEIGDNSPTLEGNKPFNCNAGITWGLACTVVNTLPEP